jgi:hypothetical protein
MQRVYVNKKRYFALAGLTVAEGTARYTHVGIGVQDEVVFWGQTTEMTLLSSGHAVLPLTVYCLRFPYLTHERIIHEMLRAHPRLHSSIGCNQPSRAQRAKSADRPKWFGLAFHGTCSRCGTDRRVRWILLVSRSAGSMIACQPASFLWFGAWSQ